MLVVIIYRSQVHVFQLVLCYFQRGAKDDIALIVFKVLEFAVFIIDVKCFFIGAGKQELVFVTVIYQIIVVFTAAFLPTAITPYIPLIHIIP